MKPQPIDTAPDTSDGSEIMVYDHGWHVVTYGQMSNINGRVRQTWFVPSYDGGYTVEDATHWTRCPPDPTKPQADPDEIVERAARMLLATRAKGLGRDVWARRVAAAIIEMVGEFE